jgi:hypothetical protein
LKQYAMANTSTSLVLRAKPKMRLFKSVKQFDNGLSMNRVIIETVNQFKKIRAVNTTKNAILHIICPQVNNEGEDGGEYIRDLTEDIAKLSICRELTVDYVCSGKKDSKEVKNKIKSLAEGKIDIIISCHILGRSVDIPRIYMTLVLRSLSINDYTQIAIGRGSRIVYEPNAPEPKDQQHLIYEWGNDVYNNDKTIFKVMEDQGLLPDDRIIGNTFIEENENENENDDNMNDNENENIKKNNRKNDSEREVSEKQLLIQMPILDIVMNDNVSAEIEKGLDFSNLPDFANYFDTTNGKYGCSIPNCNYRCDRLMALNLHVIFCRFQQTSVECDSISNIDFDVDNVNTNLIYCKKRKLQ